MANDRMTDRSVSGLIRFVSSQDHAMAGAVIALSAAQALALGSACVRISFASKDGEINPVELLLTQLSAIRQRLVELCDLDAGAIAEQSASLAQTDRRRELCAFPAETAALTLEAASLLIDFRTQVAHRVRDDLEMSITLMAGAAKASTLLLESNLRIWPVLPLIDEFAPLLKQTKRQHASLKLIQSISDLPL